MSLLHPASLRDSNAKESQAPEQLLHRRADGEGALPIGQILSLRSIELSTTTITKTLYETGEVTSTTSGLTQASTGTQASRPRVSAFVGVIEANLSDVDSVATSTVTGTSTISNVHTITRTSTSSTSSKSNTNLATGTPSAQNGTTPPATGPPPASGKVAGAIVGSFAAVGMFGILLWYFLSKRNGKAKLQNIVKMKRQKSSDVKTPHVEGQQLERTRAVMLRQASLNRSQDGGLNSFLSTSIDQSHNDQTSRLRSPVEASAAKQQWIGLAVSSSTPPDTPPLPRSNSQKSTQTFASTGQSSGSAISTVDAPFPPPLRPGKPAPILTMQQLERPQNLSPLSPRAMFNAVSNTTTKAWRRASQALSPSSYQRLDGDAPTRRKGSRSERRSRNPTMDIGPQTDGGWNGQWI